ncbi:hypothetical protein RM530_14385 [Algiphilus sp. W345]|uniref:GST N-terminal domain-containing protein n=1 Tax=Banduia mediterranea TaxID=3075609 RepID=A0ABU2WKZ3_9GAMM|nr:hypothetical protein [Algiphilus sp. W345]MDT0498536.1 hypothetical protein [Algiphilus sp. W345]
MIRFYFHPTPNPAKLALPLEGTGLAYEAVPVDTRKGEQHTPAFRASAAGGSARTMNSTTISTNRRVALCSRRTIPTTR